MQGVVAPLALGIRASLAALVIGTMTLVFSVSKAALVYSGSLAPFLSQGIGLVLMGSSLMAAIAVLSRSCRGIIVQPQDVTAVLLATTAAALVAGAGLAAEQSFATVMAMVAVSTVLAGALSYAIGQLKLAYFVRYVPRQLTAGFLAASGLLLLREAYTVVVPAVPLSAPLGLFAVWPQWLPWMGLGLALAILVRVSPHGLLVPLAFALSVALFYGALAALGIDQDVARERGWLLGPFPTDSLLRLPSVMDLAQVQWSALLPMIPTVLAVVGLCVLGALLNVMSLELLSGREADLDASLKTLGVANAASGLAGGLPGYHMVSMTSLAQRVGMPAVAAGLSVAGMSVLCLVFGADLLSDLPRGLVAAVLWYLGFDLVLATVWDYGRHIPRRDMALVLAIPLVAATLGVLPALGLGLVAACLLFVIVYAQIDVVRLFTTAAHLKARVERSPADREILRQHGERIHIYKLSGFLFFGSMQRLLMRLQRSLLSAAPPQVIVADFQRVVGMDLSAWDAVGRLSRRCSEVSVSLVLSGLSQPLRGQWKAQQHAQRYPEVQVVADLDSVLATLEAQRLAEAAPTAVTTARHEDDDLAALLQRVGQRRDVRAGETVMREGELSDSIMLLLSGHLGVKVERLAGGEARLNQLLPGAVLGEVGFYSKRLRSATVVATEDSVVLEVSAQQLEHLERVAPADAVKLHRALARAVTERLMAATLLLKDADL